MQAVLMTAVGGPDVLKLDEVDAPAVTRPTDVRVNLKAAGVNPVDTKFRSGLIPIMELPVILGCDGAGVVDTVGESVERFKPGDAVWFFHGGIGSIPGNYAEQIVLDERFLAHKPEQFDFTQAAAAPLVLITAWEALFDRADCADGKTVLVHAGAGGVGHVAIQLAKSVNAKVCTTISSGEKAAFVTDLGADKTINYHKTDFVEAVMQWTDDQGVDIVMDNVGGDMIEQSFPAVKHYGDLVTLLQPSSDIDWSIARQRNLRISLEIMLGPLLFNLVDKQHHQTWILQQCAGLAAAGKLTVNVNRTLPLADAAEAHRLIEAGGTTGKIVLTM